MKIKLLLSACILITGIAKAQYTQLPQIAAATYNVKDYGAIGDGKNLNTEAIQKALNRAKANSGTVLIPAGEYLCGPLVMYSKTNLELTKGAVLRLINDIENFPNSDGRYGNFIDASKTTDIKISGEGVIDGQGAIWWKGVEDKTLKLRRPQMLYIEGAQRVEISGVTFLNPPNTHVSLKNASDVYIHNITIKAPANSHNTDGINISAKNCTIESCTINTGDDNIAINFGNRQNADEPECKNIIIRNCTFGYGHGLSIGSFTSGGLSNLFVSNCTFDGTTSAIRIKTARGRGGVIDNINYSDLVIKNSHYPIFISEYYPHEPATPQGDTGSSSTDRIPVYKNISLKNITVSNADEAIKIWGIPESPIRNIRFENVVISAKTGAKIYNASGVEFINSTVKAQNGERLQTYNTEVKGLN